MNAKQLLEAMNGIDDRLIRKADPNRRPSPAGRAVWTAAKWAGGLAAGLAVTAGLILLGRLQTPPAGGAASGAVSPVPAEDLPALVFPVHEDWDQWLALGEYETPDDDVWDYPTWTATFDGLGISPGAVWGEDRLLWEGVDPLEELQLTGAGVCYREDGSLLFADLWLRPQEDSEFNGAINVTLAPGRIHEWVGTSAFAQLETDLYGTPVTTRYWDTGSGHAYSARFLTGGEEPIGAQIYGFAPTGDQVLTDEKVVDLLTRFVSQCLRPGNTFTLSPLAVSPQEDLLYSVSLDEDGRMAFNDERAQRLWEAAGERFGPASALTGQAAADYAGDPACRRVVSVALACPLDAYWYADCTLFAARQWTCGFFEENGSQSVRILDSQTGPWALTGAGQFLAPGDEGYEELLEDFSGGGTDAERQWKAQILQLLRDFSADDSLDQIRQDLLAATLLGQEGGAGDLAAEDGDEAARQARLGFNHWANQLSDQAQAIWSEGEQRASDEAAKLAAEDSVAMRTAAITIANDLVDQWLAQRDENGGGLSECFYRDLWIINERRGTDNRVDAFIMSLQMVFRPDPVADGWWWSGNTQEGTGDLAGYYTAKRQVQVNLIDGEWQFGGWDITLSQEGFGEPGSMGINLGNQLTVDTLLTLADKAQAGTLRWRDLSGLASVQDDRDLQFMDNGLEYYTRCDYYIRHNGSDLLLSLASDGTDTPAAATLAVPGQASIDLAQGRAAIETALDAASGPESLRVLRVLRVLPASQSQAPAGGVVKVLPALPTKSGDGTDTPAASGAESLRVLRVLRVLPASQSQSLAAGVVKVLPALPTKSGDGTDTPAGG